MLAVTPRSRSGVTLGESRFGGDDRTRTGGLSVDNRALCAPELRPRRCAGGIRTHVLELMRLARTAAPLPRVATRSGRQDANLRSPAPEAGGVADSPTARRQEQGGRRVWRPSTGAERCQRLPEPSVARQHACQPPSWTARGMPCPLSDAGCTLRPKHRLWRRPLFCHSLGPSVDSPIRRAYPRRDSNPQLPG
jgi:hypothetical protein